MRRRLAKKLDPVSALITEQSMKQYGEEAPSTGGYPDYARAYMQEIWVYICVNLIAETCSEVNADVYQEVKKGELEKIPDHPLDLLLEHPNPKLKISRYELWEFTYSCLELAGQVYWYIIKNNSGIPLQIIPLYPHRVKIIPSKEDFIGGYIYRINDEDIGLEADEVIHFKRWHPLDDFYGLSAIEAGSLAITADLYAQIFNRQFYKNSARPDGLLKTEQRLNPAEAEEARKRWDMSFKGPLKAHKVAVLGEGLDFKTVSILPKDMEFLRQREFSRDEILSLFRVPPSLLGIYNKFKATSEEEEENFKLHTIHPKLVMIEGKINAELLPMFGEDNKRLAFKFDPLVSKKDEEERERDEVDLKYGVLVPDEVRARRYGLPPHPDKMGTIPYPLMSTELTPWAESQTPPPALGEREGKLLKAKAPFFDRGRWEDDIEDTWQGFFILQRDLVLDNIRETGDFESWDDDWDRWIPIICMLMERKMSQIFQGGIDVVSREGFHTDFSSTHDRAMEWLKDHVLEKMVTQINKTTRKNIREAIIKGVEEGQSVAQIAERISEVFQGKIIDHSHLIAQYETAEAYNWGRYLTYQEYEKASGEKLGKFWITMGDNRVCEICLQNEGAGTILLTAIFPSGHEIPLAHPRCRCDFEVIRIG